MKKHLLGFPFLVVLCLAVSGHSTISSDGGATRDLRVTVNDTIKTVREADSIHTSMIDSSEVGSLTQESIFMEPWKEWRTVDNFAFGKNRGNLPMIADLQSLHPFFRDKIYQLIRNCKAKGIELAVVESYRTHAKQKEYYNMGRKYTRTTGGRSKHQYGLAVDVVPVRDSVFIWDNAVLWRKIGAEGEKLGLRWGGRWRSLYDPAHFEWSGGLTTYHLSKGMLPAIPKSFSDKYPCIEDDMEQLRRHWEMWETEQSAFARKKTSITANQK